MPGSTLDDAVSRGARRAAGNPSILPEAGQPGSNDSSSFLGPNHQGRSLCGPSSPALSHFHITDLLERSIIMGAKEREQSKLRQIVEFYKRSVKGDKELGCKRGIMIRNYRLHVVKDVAQELDASSRALFTLNKGTSIAVSNSIIKPEIHKFGTRVSDRLGEAYPFLLEETSLPPKLDLSTAKKRNFTRRSLSVHQALAGQAARPAMLSQ
jgi:hypothetical protein